MQNVTTYVWSGGEILNEYEAGRTKASYFLGRGREGLVLPQGTTRVKSHWMVSDGLGSVVGLANDQAQLTDRYEYDAWGTTLHASGATYNPYRWIGTYGCRTDADSALVYMRARWYSPALQRFVSRDPIGLEGGTNLYAYVENNPVSLIDPEGLEIIVQQDEVTSTGYRRRTYWPDRQKIKWLLAALDKTPTGRRLLEALGKTKVKLRIMRELTAPDESGRRTSGETFGFDCEKTGQQEGDLFIYLNFGAVPHNKWFHPQELIDVLGHELGHAFEAVYRPQRFLEDRRLGRTEAYAIRYWENPIRRELGHPVRRVP